MLLFLLASAAATPQLTVMPPLPHIDGMPVVDPSGPARCPPISRYEAARRGGRLPPSLLNQLPGADLYSAVFRQDANGCVVPIVVKYGIGGR